MGVPYECKPQSGLALDGNDADGAVFPIAFPSRTFINKIICKQVHGQPIDFTIELFNHPMVLSGSQVSDAAGDQQGPVPEEVFRVTPVINSKVPGYLEYFSDFNTGGFGLPFFSQEDNVPATADGPRLATPPGNKRTLYVRIKPTLGAAGDSEEKVFCLVIGAASGGE